MGFCQRLCNRVSQPPHQLRGVGIYSHGCKKGCFQTWRPGGSDPGWRDGLGDYAAGPMVQLRQDWRSTPVASPPSGWKEGYEPANRWAVAVLITRDCRPQYGREVQQPSGLGRHGSAPGGRRTLRSTQRTGAWPPVRSAENLSGAIGRVSRGLTGRTGDPPGLNNQYPTGRSNCLARTHLTGSRRGPAVSG